MQMHRKFLTFLVILVLLVSPLTVIPSVYASTVETRYFTSTSETYKGITVKKLLTTNTASALSAGIAYGRRFGVRVWWTDTSKTETEITSGTPVATVIHQGTSDDDGEYDATWACPETSLASTDRIVVKVYSSKQTPTSWSLIQTFITEQLGASKIDSATWTVHYCLYLSGTAVLFNYGSSTYPSRITNFVWTPAVTTAWHDVSLWTASLVTKTWSSGTSFNFSLQTRIWSSTYPSLYEHYNTSDNYGSGVYGIYWLAQTFTVGAEAHTVTSVKLKMFRIGNPETVTVSIRATNSSGNPTGDDLTGGTIDGNSFTEGTDGLWYEITLTEYLLNASTKYAVVVRAPDGNSTNIAGWRFRLFSSYPDGMYEYSSNSGVTWTSSPVEDLMFEVWGRRTVVSWLFDFETRIWVDAATWAYNLVTMAWENISWIFYLGTSIWTDIATWGANLVTMMWNDVATYGFNLLAMAWHDLTWLFTLLPALPEWVNVAVWIFHLVPAEWIFPFIWIIMLGFIGLCCLVLSAKPQKKRETENV